MKTPWNHMAKTRSVDANLSCLLAGAKAVHCAFWQCMHCGANATCKCYRVSATGAKFYTVLLMMKSGLP